MVAVGLIAAIGPVERFAGPHQLVAHLGLNPSVHQSGSGKPRHGRITKEGRSHARTMLVEAAWQAVRGPGPLRTFFQRVSGRRGAHIAAVAVARKLAVIIWHLLNAWRGLRMGTPSAPCHDTARPQTEQVLHAWMKEPERFGINPSHHIPGQATRRDASRARR